MKTQKEKYSERLKQPASGISDHYQCRKYRCPRGFQENRAMTERYFLSCIIAKVFNSFVKIEVC